MAIMLPLRRNISWVLSENIKLAIKTLYVEVF